MRKTSLVRKQTRADKSGREVQTRPLKHRRDERPQKRAFERFAGTACKRAHRAETNIADEEDDEQQARPEDDEQQARPSASPRRATSDAGMRYEQCARLCEKAAVRE